MGLINGAYQRLDLQITGLKMLGLSWEKQKRNAGRHPSKWLMACISIAYCGLARLAELV